jgi:hypothetical protein
MKLDNVIAESEDENERDTIKRILTPGGDRL